MSSVMQPYALNALRGIFGFGFSRPRATSRTTSSRPGRRAGGPGASGRLADRLRAPYALLPRCDHEVEVGEAGDQGSDDRGGHVDEHEVRGATAPLAGHDGRAEGARWVEARAGQRREDHHAHAERGADGE